MNTTDSLLNEGKIKFLQRKIHFTDVPSSSPLQSSILEENTYVALHRIFYFLKRKTYDPDSSAQC